MPSFLSTLIVAFTSSDSKMLYPLDTPYAFEANKKKRIEIDLSGSTFIVSLKFLIFFFYSNREVFHFKLIFNT